MSGGRKCGSPAIWIVKQPGGCTWERACGSFSWESWFRDCQAARWCMAQLPCVSTPGYVSNLSRVRGRAGFGVAPDGDVEQDARGEHGGEEGGAAVGDEGEGDAHDGGQADGH